MLCNRDESKVTQWKLGRSLLECAAAMFEKKKKTRQVKVIKQQVAKLNFSLRGKICMPTKRAGWHNIIPHIWIKCFSLVVS